MAENAIPGEFQAQWAAATAAEDRFFDQNDVKALQQALDIWQELVQSGLPSAPEPFRWRVFDKLGLALFNLSRAENDPARLAWAISVWEDLIPNISFEPPVRQTVLRHLGIGLYARLDPDSIAQFPERVLTINVECDPRDGSLDIRFLDRTADNRAVAQYDNHLQPEALGKAVGDARRLLSQTVSGVKNGATTQGYQWILEAPYDLLNVWLLRLANAGRSLYRALLPRGGMQPPAEDQGERLKAALQPGAVIQVNPVLGKVAIPCSVLYERELRTLETSYA